MQRVGRLNLEVVDEHGAEGRGRAQRLRPPVFIADVRRVDGQCDEPISLGVVNGILTAEGAQISDVPSDPRSGSGRELEKILAPPRSVQAAAEMDADPSSGQD